MGLLYTLLVIVVVIIVIILIFKFLFAVFFVSPLAFDFSDMLVASGIAQETPPLLS